MRKLLLPFICLIGLNACNSDQNRPEQKVSATSRKPVQNESGKDISETGSKDKFGESATVDSLIVPGKRIGLINLNEDAEVVHKLLGKSNTANSGMGKSLQTWKLKSADGKDYQLSIFFSRNMGNADEKSRAKQIRITSAAFITKPQEASTILKGNIQEAKKSIVYTLPGSKGLFAIYDNVKKGIAFEFDPQGNIIAITVHEPGQAAFEIFTEISPDLKKVEPSEQTSLPFPGIKD